MHQNSVKSVVTASYLYVLHIRSSLLHIRSSSLLIIDLVMMCNNDVIMESYYYIFLRIIDQCTKM